MIVDLEYVVVRPFELECEEPAVQLIWPGDGEEPPRAEIIWGRERLQALASFLVMYLKQTDAGEQDI